MGLMESSGEDPKKYGLRIYTIIKNGPLDKGGACELSDFIIPPEEVLSNQTTFEDWVQTHSNQEINLSIYSLLTKKFREIKIKTNPLGSKDGILGASVRKENWTMANKRVLHIISVKENSGIDIIFQDIIYNYFKMRNQIRNCDMIIKIVKNYKTIKL